MFIRDGGVHLVALSVSLGSSGIVGITRVGPGRRSVHLRSLGSLGSVLVVVGYILGRSVRPGSHWLYLGSSRVVGFTQFRPVFRWVLPGSLGSSGDVGFTRVHTGCRGFIRGRWVHSGAPWGSMDSCRVVKFTRLRPGGHCVHVGSLDSLVFALGVVGFIWNHWVDSGSPFGLLGSSTVVEFTMWHLHLLAGQMVPEFTRVRPGCR